MRPSTIFVILIFIISLGVNIAAIVFALCNASIQHNKEKKTRLVFQEPPSLIKAIEYKIEMTINETVNHEFDNSKSFFDKLETGSNFLVSDKR